MLVAERAESNCTLLWFAYVAKLLDKTLIYIDHWLPACVNGLQPISSDYTSKMG